MSVNLLVAPPASSARLLANQFGAYGCALRFSTRAYSGVVMVARFASRQAARSFAPVAARLSGVPVKIRGSAISVPVATVQPLVAVPTLRPAHPAKRIVSPNRPSGARCTATTHRGTQCTRRVVRGRHCWQHARGAR